MDYNKVREKCNEIKKQIEAAVLVLGINLKEEGENGVYIHLNVDPIRKHRYGGEDKEYGSRFYVTVGYYRHNKIFRKNPLPIDEIAAFIKERIFYGRESVKTQKKADDSREANDKLAKEISEKHGLRYGVLDSDSSGLIIKLDSLNAENANKALNLLKVAGIIE
jgi:hypothetical protein